MKVAFVLDTFPALSETFILNQITALIDNGFKVDIYAAIDQRKSKTHPNYNRYRLCESTIYEEQWKGSYLKKFVLTKLHILLLFIESLRSGYSLFRPFKYKVVVLRNWLSYGFILFNFSTYFTVRKEVLGFQKKGEFTS